MSTIISSRTHRRRHLFLWMLLIAPVCAHVPAAAADRSFFVDDLVFDHPLSNQLSRDDLPEYHYFVPLRREGMPISMECHLALLKGKASLALTIYNPKSCSDSLVEAPQCTITPPAAGTTMVCRIDSFFRYYVTVRLSPKVAQAKFELLCAATQIKPLLPAPVTEPAALPPAPKRAESKVATKPAPKRRPVTTVDLPADPVPPKPKFYPASPPQEPPKLQAPPAGKPKSLSPTKPSATLVTILRFAKESSDGAAGASGSVAAELTLRNVSCLAQRSGNLRVGTSKLQFTVKQSFSDGRCKVRIAAWEGDDPDSSRTYELTFDK